MANDNFIFKGILFPFAKGTNGYPAVATDKDIIKNDLLILLTTRKRERINYPNFGLELERLIFSNTGPLLRAKLFRQISDAIINNEPRVNLVDVQIKEDKNTVEVYVIYQIGRISDSVTLTVGREGNGQ